MCFKKAIAYIAAVFMLIPFLANAQDKVFTIACDKYFPPFSFKQENKYVGIDVELLDAIAKEAHFKYELKPMNFSNIFPELLADNIDGAVAGVNINEARKKIFDFSEGYFYTGLSIVVKTDSNYQNLDDLRGKTAAVKQATTGFYFVEDNASRYDFKSIVFASSDETLAAVKNNQADFFMEDYPVIAYQIKIGTQEGIRILVPFVDGRHEYGFVVRKGNNKELLQKFNEGLKKIKENGTYDKILANYL